MKIDIENEYVLHLKENLKVIICRFLDLKKVLIVERYILDQKPQNIKIKSHS